MKLRDVMRNEVPTASSDEGATEAWERMRATGADYMVVTRNDEIVGILSWHDLSGPAGGGHRRMGRRVGELMQREVVTAGPETTVAQAAASMREHRVGCLPVLDHRKLVGIVTVDDMLGVLARGSSG
jgi:acetoin utilization protein AcuB